MGCERLGIRKSVLASRLARRLWLSQPFPFSNSREPLLVAWLLTGRGTEFRDKNI